MADVPFFPSLVAVIVAGPAVTPVTAPAVATVAIPVALDDHAIVRPVRRLPAESFGVAVSCAAAPTNKAADAGLIVTDATGTIETASEAVPLWPSLVAVMVAEPAATPVTRPLGLTVATPVALLVHVIVRPVSGLPAESSGLAVSCLVPPTKRLAGLGLTDTDATGTKTTATALESARELPISLAVT